MRKLLIFIAVVFTYVSYGQAPDSSARRIGYANLEYITSRLPDMKAIETDMKSTQTQLRNQIQARSQEVQKQYQDFTENAAGLPDTVRARRQEQIEQAMADLERMQQDAQVTLQNKQKLLMAPLYLKINRAIEEVARENGYELILTEKMGGFSFLLFSDKRLDVSDLVLRKLGVNTAAGNK